MDLDKIKKRLRDFAADRDWQEFHTPKNLSMALSVEVAELVEIFQWSKNDGLDEIKDPKTRKEIEKEIADVFNYLVRIADICNIDLEAVAHEKIEENAKKYPLNKAKGNSTKYSKR